MADSNPIQAAQDALASLNAQKEALGGQLSTLSAQGVVWNDPKYQVVQEQYNRVTSAIPAAYQYSKDLQNQILGIIGSSGPAITRTLGQSAGEQEKVDPNTLQTRMGVVSVGQDVGGSRGSVSFSPQGAYAQSLANQGVSVTPLGNLLPAGSTSTQSVQSNRVETLPQELTAGTPYNTIVNAINQYRDQATLNQIINQGAQQRAGYYGLASENLGQAKTIGDTQTQQYQKALGSFASVLGSRELASMGAVSGFVPSALSSEQNRTAVALEYQRQTSARSGVLGYDPISGTYNEYGGTRQAQYYSGELQKLISRPIEKSAEYHYVGKALDIPIPANPYEAQADIAVEILKGTPTKSSEVFSPLSGLASMYLPGGMGVQQQAWETARTGVAPQVSFLPAIGLFAAAEGKYGPYGTLYGGPSYTGTPSSDGIRRQAPFVLTPDVVSSSYEAIRVGGQPSKISADYVKATERTYAPTEALPTGEFVPTRKGNIEIGGAPIPPSGRLVGGGKVASVPTTAILPKESPSTVDIAAETRKGYTGGLLGYLAFGENAQKVIAGWGLSSVDFAVGVASLGLIDKPLSGFVRETQYTQNPVTLKSEVSKVYDYGEYSKWGEGAAKVLQASIGLKPGQIEAYQPIVEQKGSDIERLVYGAGSTVYTTPEKIPTAVGGGALLFVGGSAIGAIAKSASAGAGAIATGTQAVSRAASYVLPAAFTGAMAYSVTEGFTASIPRTEVNIGKLYPELVGATYGGIGAYGAGRAIEAGYVGLGTKQIPTVFSLEDILTKPGEEVPSVKQIRQIPIGEPKTFVPDPFLTSPEFGIKTGTEVMDINRLLTGRPSGAYPEGVVLGQKPAAPFSIPQIKEIIPDTAPMPMDLLPGINAGPVRSPILPGTPRPSTFGINLKIESLSQEIVNPKGISMPTGVSSAARQITINPEIQSSTRAGSFTSIEDVILKSEARARIKPAVSAVEQQNILPSATKQTFETKAIFSSKQFENIFKAVSESEKRTSQPAQTRLPKGMQLDYLRDAMKGRGEIIKVGAATSAATTPYSITKTSQLIQPSLSGDIVSNARTNSPTASKISGEASREITTPIQKPLTSRQLDTRAVQTTTGTPLTPYTPIFTSAPPTPPRTPITPEPNPPVPTTPYVPNVPTTKTPDTPPYPPTTTIPIIPIPPMLPQFYGGGSSPGGAKRRKRAFVETFNIGLDISTFGPGAYNPMGGKSGGFARKRSAPKKKLSVKKRGKK